MSKRKRRTRKKKTEETPVEETQPEKTVVQIIPTDEAESGMLIAESEPAPKTVVEQILLTAPTLPWRFDKTYVATDFRKAYINLLRKLVALHNLNYLVDQTAVLTPQ